MIRVEFEQAEELCALSVKGHAGYGGYGRDIVCAAVSALVVALADYVEAEAGCEAQTFVEVRPGHAVVRAGGKTCEAFRPVYRGLCRLARTYPEHVVVEVSGERKDKDLSNKEETT